MTHNASYSGFNSLPLEIRDEIYRHLLPDVDDICPVPHSRRQLYRRNNTPSLRIDDSQCHPSVLALNKQINAEASRVLYARTYTLKFCLNRVTFLGRDYASNPLHAGAAQRWEDFLLRFPFPKVRKLRLQISTIASPATASRDLRKDLYTNLGQVVEVANKAEQSLKRLSIEMHLCSFEFLGRLVRYDTPDPQDLCRLFDILKFGASGCEIKFPLRLKDSEDLMQRAKEFGRAVTAGKSEPIVSTEDLEAWDWEQRIIHLQRKVTGKKGCTRSNCRISGGVS